MKYLITVTITSYDNQPDPVPGSIAHSVQFSDKDTNHRVLQMARDAAEAVVLGYLTSDGLPTQ